MSQGTKEKLVGVILAIAGVVGAAGIVGMYQGFRAGQFLNEVVYTDPQGNTITRGQVLGIVGNEALRSILQNAEKAQQSQQPSPEIPPASPVK